MKLAALSDIGKVRADNQDSFMAMRNRDGLVFLCVADGMGGHKAGDVASRVTVRELKSYFSMWENTNFFKSTKEISDMISQINDNVYRLSCENPEYEGMGTTLTLCVTNGESAHVYHVGDSRTYVINKDGDIRRITKDHSLVQYMVDTGQITAAEARKHPNRNVITRCIGTEDDVKVDFFKFELLPGDTVMLCTDGLTDGLTDSELAYIIHGSENADDACRKLVDAANERGGRDNITVVLMEC